MLGDTPSYNINELLATLCEHVGLLLDHNREFTFPIGACGRAGKVRFAWIDGAGARGFREDDRVVAIRIELGVQRSC